jgi:hypothetical protein
MKIYKIAQFEQFEDGIGTGQSPQSPVNALDGMKKVKAARIVNDLMGRYTKGFFSDEDWHPVNKIWEELRENNIPYELKSADYRQREDGTPIAKVWKFEVKFLNENNKPAILYGYITASGAGSVSSPMDRYDLVTTIS